MLDSVGIIPCCNVTSGLFLPMKWWSSQRLDVYCGKSPRTWPRFHAKVESLLPRATERERAKAKALSTGLVLHSSLSLGPFWWDQTMKTYCRFGEFPLIGAVFGLVTQWPLSILHINVKTIERWGIFSARCFGVKPAEKSVELGRCMKDMKGCWDVTLYMQRSVLYIGCMFI